MAYAEDFPSRDDYGFDFAGTGKDEDGNSLDGRQTRLPDETVTISNQKGGTIQLTHRIMLAESYESEGVHTVGGETYLGPDASGELVGRIKGEFFDTSEMDESLQMAADCTNGEIYDAMEALFGAGGVPKGAFKAKCVNYEFSNILYIGGVFVKKSHRGQGLGLDIVRELVRSLSCREGSGCDVVLLCPAGEPNPGPQAWAYVFDTLASMFKKMKFQRCGSETRRSGQSMYMFLEPGEDESVLYPPPLPKVEITIKKDPTNDTKPTAIKREQAPPLPKVESTVKKDPANDTKPTAIEPEQAPPLPKVESTVKEDPANDTNPTAIEPEQAPPLPKVESTAKKDPANDTKPTAIKREQDSIVTVPKRQKTESEK
jgi:predicted GNAT family acetyltransferase